MMKSFCLASWWWWCFAVIACLHDPVEGTIPSDSSSLRTRRKLQRKKIQFFGPEPDPTLMETTFPLKECQGACLKDDHCGHLLVCKLKKSSADFPCAVSEKDTRTYVGERFCVPPDEGEELEEGSEANGAVVLSVNVISREEVLAQEAAEKAEAEGVDANNNSNNNNPEQDQSVAGSAEDSDTAASEQQRQDDEEEGNNEPQVESLIAAELELQQQAENSGGATQSSPTLLSMVAVTLGAALATGIIGLI